jgi:hypothetical protein
VEIHGFVSQGFIKTTQNNYLAASERGSFEFSEVGLNFTKSLGDRLRLGAQLFTRDLGPIGNYRPTFDWFYLDYRVTDALGIRAGRTKLPFGLYNETSDVDAARVPILLPQSMYPLQSREFLLAQTGVELYGYQTLGPAGALDYRVYGGTVFFDIGEFTAEFPEFEVPYIFGTRVMWLPPLNGLQLGASVQALRLEGEYVPPPALVDQARASGVLPADFSGKVDFALPALLAVGSIEYAPSDLTLAAEYSRWRVPLESSVPALIPESRTVSERFYVMASYRVTSWFTPGLYYSVQYNDIANRDGRAAYQHDLALSLRYDLDANWLLKLESHYMSGTAGLTSALNGGAPLGTLPRDWGVFMAKTTAYF